jgi:RecA-family ATPase
MQAIDVRSNRWTQSLYAHAKTLDEALKHAQTAAAFDCAGLYVIANLPNPEIAYRAGTEAWHPIGKGAGTSDAEIDARTVLYVDIDWSRPKGISCSDEQLEALSRVAAAVYDELVRLLGGADSIAYGTSGNGRSLFVALDYLSNDDETKRLVSGALVAIEQRYQQGKIKIDTSVCDAKRLVPLFGSVKKKGISTPGRSHRPAGIVAPRVVRRVDAETLRGIVARLRDGCDDAGRTAVDKAMGIKPEPRATTPGASSPTHSSESPFTRANDVPILDVLNWQGLLDGAQPVCPGCGEQDGSTVAIVGNGLKCLHARCAGKGKPGGYRTPVDVVVESQRVSPIEAVGQLAERFGFDGPRTPKAAASVAPSSDPWSERVAPSEMAWFTSAPPKRRWLLRDSRTALSSGVLPLGKVGLLIGEGGVSKTMALVAFAVAVATGTAWLGCYSAATQGRVLVLLGEEDAEEVHRRCYNVARATAAPVPDPGSIVVVPLAGLPCPMVETDERGNAIDAPFLLWLRSYVSQHGPFALILVDPLSRFAGRDAEVDNAAATRFVQALESIATETGATVVCAHHTNKTARGSGATVNGASARGSSAIYDGARWAAALSAESIPCGDAATASHLGEVVTLSIVKSNYSKKGEPLLLRRDHEHGGALLPLDVTDLQIVADARANTGPSRRRRAEREADREATLQARAAKDAAERDRRAEEASLKAAARRADEDAALRACVVAEPGLSEARLLSAMRARLGSCSDAIGRTAIERGRQAGWLGVRTGAKNAKGHYVTGAS